MESSRATLPSRRGPFSVLTGTDLLLLCLLAALMFALCVVRSRTRLLWPDELLGFHVVGDPSFFHMFRGWWEGADGGGPIYYLLAHVWMRIFGINELALRSFSTLGMASALLLVWTLARRAFPTVPVAWSVGLAFFTIPVMIWQQTNGRFYGTFLAFAAFASLWFVVTAEHEPSRADLVLTFLAQAGLVGSHILGIVYSVALVLGLFVLDLGRRRLRWPLYLAGAAGWLLLPASWHAIRSSTSITQGTFWTQKPHLRELLQGLALYGKWALVALLCLLFLSTVQRYLPQLWAFPTARPSRPLPALAALIMSLLAAQLVLFIKGHFGISVYADRYLLPLAVVLVLLYAWMFSSLLPARLTSPRSPAAVFGFSALLLVPTCAYAAAHDIYRVLYPPLGYPQKLLAPLPPGAPVLVSLLPPFTLLSTYQTDHPVYFLLDWSYDLDPHHPKGDFSGSRLVENRRNAGYDADHVLPCPATFARNPDLYILLDPGRTPWLRDRLLSNPAFRTEKVADFPDWEPLTLWHTRRVQPGPPPC